jgi:hypothetical protein
MNPFDPCVWNKEVKKRQLTICFHVDQCKISHVNQKVLEKTVEWLWSEYKSIFEDRSGKMKVHFGKIYKYLGMTLDYSKKGKVKVSMFNYVKEVLSSWDLVNNQQDADGFDIVISKKKVPNSAAPDDLFKVDEL